jgi:hypothetical protein
MSYPVKEEVLLEALRLEYSDSEWTLDNGTVYWDRWRAYHFRDAKGKVIRTADTEVPFDVYKYVCWLMKPRPARAIDGWYKHVELRSGTTHYPYMAETGTEYVEACKWYDRCVEVLNAPPSETPRFCLKPLAEKLKAVSCWKSWVVNKSGSLTLMMNLEVMTDAGVLKISKKNRWSIWNDLVKVLSENPELAPACAVEAVVGPKTPYDAHLRPPSLCRSRPPLTPPEQPLEPTITEFGPYGFQSDVTVVGEPSWERQARIAAHAGYAHGSKNYSSGEELWNEGMHKLRLKEIAKGITGHATYVHKQPPEHLSGTRTVNGWAVSGFAVTDADAPFTEGETGEDVV